MNIQSYGRNLLEAIAERSLQVLRGTTTDDLKRIFGVDGAGSASTSHAGAAVGAFAVGAAVGVGLTALYTPTTGPELRKRLEERALSARERAIVLGENVRTRIEDVRSSLSEGVEEVSTRVGRSRALLERSTAGASKARRKADGRPAKPRARPNGKRTSPARRAT